MERSPVIFLLADGARYDVFERLLKSGQLSNLPGRLHTGITCFPSVTGPAYLPFITGAFPGTANIPGIRWFDRQEYGKWWKPSWKRFRSYCGPGSFFFKHDLHPEVKTLFEHHPENVNIYNHFQRGIGRGRYIMKYARITGHLKSYFTGNWLAGDEEILNRTLNWIHSVQGKIPEFTFMMMNSIDEMSHHHGPFHEKTLASYAFLNRFVGEVKRALQKYGVEPEWMMGADHGHSETHTHIDLVGHIESQGYRPLYHPVIFRKFIDSAVMVSGNSMAHVYVKSPARGWTIRTTSEYLNHEHSKLLDSLVNREGIDFIAMKSGHGRIHVITSKGRMWFRILPNGRIDYDVTSGQDPLQLHLQPLALHVSEALIATATTDYPDSLVQLHQIFQSPRTGDIIVSAKPGYDLRGPWEYPEHFSSHGSLHRDHMVTPLLSTLPLKVQTLRTADVYATICEYLKYPVPARCDGLNHLSTPSSIPLSSREPAVVQF